MIRKNHSFLYHVYSISEMEIDDDAMLEIYDSMEKFFIKYIETSINLCLSRGEKKVTERHLRDVSHMVSTLRKLSFTDCQHSLRLQHDEENERNLRILDIREQLRLLEKKEQRKKTLDRIKQYKKEMRKRTKEKSKRTNKMIQSIKLLSS